MNLVTDKTSVETYDEKLRKYERIVKSRTVQVVFT